MRWSIDIHVQVGRLALDVDLSGEHTPVAIIGPNGCGKTTLLRVIAGAQTAGRGKMVVGDTVLFDDQQGIDLPPERRNIGYVPQGCGLFPHLRVLDNVAFGLTTSSRRQSRAARLEAAHRILTEVECDHLADRLPAALSGGEQQRVALARALIVEPALLLLDEPLSAMDVTARRTLRQFVAARLRQRRKPAIVVTHDLRDALALEAEICVIEGGRVVQRGHVDDLRERPATEFVAEFVGAVPATAK